MNHNEATREARRRLHAGLLPAFDEIAQMCLCIVRGAGKGVKAFASLQSYLDGSITVCGTWFRRRCVLLKIHDMAEEKEAPAVYQRKIHGQFLALKVSSIPQLKLYRDVATALLKMEVIMRMSAAQAAEKAAPEPALSPVTLVHWQELRQWFNSSVEALSGGFENFKQAAAPAIRARVLAARRAGSFIGRATTHSSPAAVASA